MRAGFDFSEIPLVDDHCHALLADQQFAGVLEWQRYFAETREPETIAGHVRTTAFFRRALVRLARLFECEPTADAVFEARSRVSDDSAEIIRAVLGDTNTSIMVADDGLPARDIALPHVDFYRITGIRVASLLRLELLMQELVVRHDRLDDVEGELQVTLRDVRKQGYVGLKSIVAYRTGLAIGQHPRKDALAAFQAARAEVAATGGVRIAHKPLLDTLLGIAFTEAARQGLPVQFHTGYGDTDADMLLANPLHLRWVLENPKFRGMKTVLLHESYPYTRQAAYLAAMYDGVYVDLSFGIPFLSVREMVHFTHEAFGVAPSSKLLYASDAIWIPELFAMSALDGRRVLSEVVGDLVRDGDLAFGDAEATAEAVLGGNAMKLYGL
jgi:uncharacterized protein